MRTQAEQERKTLEDVAPGERGVIQCPSCKEKFALDLSDECCDECCDDGCDCGCGCEHDHDEE